VRAAHCFALRRACRARARRFYVRRFLRGSARFRFWLVLCYSFSITTWVYEPARRQPI